MLYVVKDMKLGVNLLEGDRAGWFEENLRKEISDDRNSRFWFDPWLNGILIAIILVDCLRWRWIKTSWWLR
jgi:hypothetical protein